MAMGVGARRAAQLAAIFAAGDGLTTALRPREQLTFWRPGPRLWERLFDPFVRHPELTRTLALAQAVAGVMIAHRLARSSPNGARS
jgi:hypothetical protein